MLSNDFTTEVEFLKNVSYNCSKKGLTQITTVSTDLLDQKRPSSIISELDLKFEF